MLDLKYIKENLTLVKENTLKRKVEANPELVVELYDRRSALIGDIEGLRQKRNRNAARMKSMVSAEERDILVEEGRELKGQIADFEEELGSIESSLMEEAVRIPNMSHPQSPDGEDETDNKEIKQWGRIPEFNYQKLDHVELGKRLDILDFERGTKVSGQKFYYLKNEGVLLELALIRYAFDKLKDEGFTLVTTPDLAKEKIVRGIGFNPRGPESNIYTLEDNEGCLIGTAEITLGGYFEGETIDSVLFPLKLAGFSHCFRREAGAAGKYSKGLYRVHQFSKVEMFVFCHPVQSEETLEYLLSIEESLFQGLEIPYRIVDTCTGDLGGPAFRKFDIEAWMPGRGLEGEYGEVTSVSNCTDYQSRRLGIRFKENGKNKFVHMLNGTAIAISRALIVLLENFQQEDGSVLLPNNLIQYAGFSKIVPKI